MSRYCLSIVIWLTLLTASSSTASAQIWFDRESCTVDYSTFYSDYLTESRYQELVRNIDPEQNSLGRLWKITSKSGKISHLWGTMHSTDRKIIDLPKDIISRIQNSDVAAFEIDFRVSSDGEYRRAMQGIDYYYQTPTRHLPNFSLEIENWIKIRLSSMGYTSLTFDRIKPGGFVAILLGHPCSDYEMGVIPIQDTRLQTLAYVAGVKSLGLEGKFDLIEKLNKTENRDSAFLIAELYASYLSPKLPTAMTSTYHQLYLRGEIGIMQQLDRMDIRNTFEKDKAEAAIKAVNKHIIDDRNYVFIKNAIPLLDRGNAFIAVGAFHLPGPNGMITLLRNEGYQVERVFVEGEVEHYSN